MEPRYQEVILKADESQKLAMVQKNGQHQEFSLFIPEADPHTINTSDSTILNEVQQLKEEIQQLKMHTAVISLGEPQKETFNNARATDPGFLQRVEECLRKHSDEWNSGEDLKEFSTEGSIRTALDTLDSSIRYKSMASHYLTNGFKSIAEDYQRYYDSSDDEVANDEQYRQSRDKLIAKRREYVRSVELNMEVISEELIKFRLAKKLRKKELERERREAEEKAAKEKAAKEEAAAAAAASAAANPEDTINQAPNDTIFAEPKINSIDWVSFKKLRKVDESRACAIDVLIGEPVVEIEAPRGFYGTYGSWAKNKNTDKRVDDTTQFQKTNTTASSGPQGQIPLPERVRIHSTPILKIFAELIDPDGTTLALDGSPVVFLRPFKAFFHYEQRLRDWHKRLEEKFIKSTVPFGPMPKEKNRDATSYYATESIVAMKHLQCLLEFFDTYMVSKREYLSSPECKRVHFSDLWYLYRPGMDVIGLDGRQAYRVLQVNSAKHESISPHRSFYSYRGGSSQKAEFRIICSCIDFDGKSIGPVLHTFEIKRFDGERDITSFDVYPVRFHKLRRGDFGETEWNDLEKRPEQERCRTHLVRRGAKFVEVAAIKHMYYSGSTMVVKEEVESQVVIDFETAFATEGEMKEHIKPPSLETFIGGAIDARLQNSSSSGGCTCCSDDTVYDDSYVDKNQRDTYINNILSTKNAQEEPSVAVFPRLFSEIRADWNKVRYFLDDELAIMSYRVFGFVLRNRKWAQLDLTYLTEVQENSSSFPSMEEHTAGKNSRWHQKLEQPKTAFDRLVLEKGHKDMIVSLITQHFRDRESKGAQIEQMDIVRGKGKGLILLLHGAPGVGKTTTAEGVAELFKKPLFQITCGDLGVTARDVEKALEINFNLATRWGCILLLDEADVFLAARDKEDFVRNGLVAAFLRVLEYYAGILFLTTNRIGDFDEAFTSRIHMSLYYPELDGEKTIEIFKLNLKLIQDRFRRMKRIIDIDQEGIKRFAEMHFWYYHASRWNGRQIRNACQTALALAEYQAQQSIDGTEYDPKVRLTVQHFETVRDSYVEFTKYLGALYGANTSRRAKENFLRNEQDSDKEEENFLTTDELYRKYKQRFNKRPTSGSRQRRLNNQTDCETQEPQLGQTQHAKVTRSNNNSAWLQPDSSNSHKFEPQLKRAAYQQHTAIPSSSETQPAGQLHITSQQSRGNREKLIKKQYEDAQDIDNGDSSSPSASETPVRSQQNDWEYQQQQQQQQSQQQPQQQQQQQQQQQRFKRVPIREEEDDGASVSTNKERNIPSASSSRSGRFFPRSFRRHKDQA